ncbi:MAG TPA: hypothetical protein VNE41_00145 [Chitinophagaceae bacterium]|nr:hypothetical protein [Chitinophagaceae bacterium]
MRPLYYGCLAILLIFCSCKKQYSVELPSGNNSGSDSGTYFPSTAGSTWTYTVTSKVQLDSQFVIQYLDSLGFTLAGLDSLGFSIGSLDSLFASFTSLADTSYLLTVNCTGQDTMINGKSNTIYTTNGNEVYLNKSNGNYTFIGQFFGTTTSGILINQQASMLVLKDNQPVGTTWQDSLGLLGYTDIYNYSIKAKGIAKTVNGVVFNNVIEVEYSLTNTIFPFNASFITVDDYFALNKGLISVESAPAIGGGTIDEELTSYTIK